VSAYNFFVLNLVISKLWASTSLTYFMSLR